MEAWMNTISPFVRKVKILKSSSLSGEWVDYDHVFTYIEQGEADFILNGVKYLVQEGDVLLMSPFMSHIIRTTSAAPVIQYIFHFDLYYDGERSAWTETGITMDKQRQIPEREMRLASLLPISHLRPADRIELKRSFLMMHKASLDERGNNALLMKAVCIELLFLFLKGQINSGSHEGKMTKGWVFIERTISFINGHYWDPQLDNASISKHAGISTNHLSFLFKEQLNITIHKYLMHVRIEQAKQRILEGGKTLTVIAREVGFSGIHLFSRAFKAMVGVTPSHFQASNSKLWK
ncbi:AraC family transcriptional regulator [Paenibacillus sepulcri]|uniref:AraC family transcriptional regulator n=1 Tax=Paenibacillus sepulcri TaxID=359917 RepID=A0ABS7BXP4_9BACL|nr:AraC family transcriptional regulator [Paenibacillus sepulcri]